jgi:WD40 repeat protein
MQTVNPTGMTDSVMAFGFDRDENAIVYPDIKTNGLAHVWSIPGNAELRNFPIAGGSYSFLSSEDGLTVASSADYKTYSFYDTKTGQKTGNDVNTAGANSTRYGNLILTKNNAYIADQVDSANVIRVFKIADGTSTIKIFSGSNYVASVTASRNEKNLAAVSNGILRIWTLQ